MMFDSLYNLIYGAIFSGAQNIAPELSAEICSWLAVAGNVFLIGLPFVAVYGLLQFITHLGR